MKAKIFYVAMALVMALSLMAVAVPATPVKASPGELHVGPGQPYATIGAAITAAQPFDTIIVHDGTYHEQVIVDKPLTLKGANAGIPGYGTRGAESIVDADDPDEPTWVSAFFITSGDVTIDGFKTIDADEGIHVACDLPTWGDRENVTIKNNYIDTSEGYPQTDIAATGIIYYNDANRHVTPTAYSVDGAVVQDNYIDQEHQKSSIWFQDVNGSITIKGNKIDGNPCDNGIILGATSALGFYIDLSGTVIEDNDVDGCSYGIQLKRVATSSAPMTVANNILHYGGTDGGTGVRLWNIGSEAVIQGNTITNNKRGFELGRGGGSYPVNNISILSNDILDNAIGIRIRNGGLGTGNKAHFNNIVGNNQFGVENWDTVVFDAENNWWGHCSGPYDPDGTVEVPPCTDDPASEKNSDGTGDKVSDNVDYCPWLIGAWPDTTSVVIASFEDPRRGTRLCVGSDNTFRFTAPDGYDTGIITARRMRVRDGRIFIYHRDGQLGFWCRANSERGYCFGVLHDRVERARYIIYDPPDVRPSPPWPWWR